MAAAKGVKIKGYSKLVLNQLTKEYKCIKENISLYFVTTNLLLRRFYSVDIKYVPGLENQEANDLVQIAPSYRISKEKFVELIEVIEKLILTNILPLNC